jgi:hypothetical protein
MGMRLVRIALVGALTAGVGSSVLAQTQESVDVDKLPLNLERVQISLKRLAESPDVGPFHVHYYIDVFGRPPLIELFSKDDNLKNGPVPYGGPTHNELLSVITPIEYRSPAMDLNALARWLSDRFNKKPDTK